MISLNPQEVTIIISTLCMGKRAERLDHFCKLTQLVGGTAGIQSWVSPIKSQTVRYAILLLVASLYLAE